MSQLCQANGYWRIELFSSQWVKGSLSFAPPPIIKAKIYSGGHSEVKNVGKYFMKNNEQQNEIGVNFQQIKMKKYYQFHSFFCYIPNLLKMYTEHRGDI